MAIDHEYTSIQHHRTSCNLKEILLIYVCVVVLDQIDGSYIILKLKAFVIGVQ